MASRCRWGHNDHVLSFPARVEVDSGLCSAMNGFGDESPGSREEVDSGRCRDDVEDGNAEGD
jgi:hypothetical protein